MQIGVRQVPRQPIAALRQRLRLAVDGAHVVARADAEQAMVNPQRQLAANSHGRAREAIERVGDAAVGRVLHRHDAELRLAAFDFFEHGRDRADRHQLGRLAESLDRGQVAERELRSEIGDAKRRLHGPRAADSSRKTARTASSLSGPGLLATACSQDLRFARGVEDCLSVGLLQLRRFAGRSRRGD